MNQSGSDAEEMQAAIRSGAKQLSSRSLSSSSVRHKFGLDALAKIRAARECVTEFEPFADGDFDVEPLRGGMTNLLWTVGAKANALQNAKTKTTSVPIALVREYGRGTESFLDRLQEERVVKALSEMNLCPKVYATYSWGRVEQFLSNARTLSTSEYASYEHLENIAHLLGRFHARSTELLKLCSTEGHESRLKERMEQWYDLARKIKFEAEDDSSETRRKTRKLSALDVDTTIRSEIDWLLAEIERIKSPVVFAHCDLQEGNVLLHNGTMHMIDFEYSDRFERGFDLGNCFCEMSIDYGVKDYPGFVVNPNMFPDLQKQACFVRAYAKGAGLDYSLETVKQLLKEANVFVMGSHLHWVIWAIVQAGSSTIDFGYIEYAEQRMDQYYNYRRNWTKILASIDGLKE